ncbi:MAG TPA: hypothetical protein VFI73_06525 [Candidatus Nitrosopolaris sp.]|nr:hypothetical protein [Candidatus Nitrosopolaris sp.]
MIWTQSVTNFLFSTAGLTLIILFASLVIFGWLTVRNRNIRSFELQVSVFIIVYILGEILEDYKIPSLLISLPYIGSQIHIVSAVLLAIILWFRLYDVRRSGRKMIDKLEPVEEGNVNGAKEDI